MEKQIKMKVKIGEKHFLAELGQEVVITEELVKAMPDKFEVENELKFEKGKVYYSKVGGGNFIFRFKELKDKEIAVHYTCVKYDGKIYYGINSCDNIIYIENSRLATPEEIALLEEADRKHGYKYNPDTMELEEIEPLFVTEDGVKIYGYSEVTPVNKETFEILPTKKYNGDNSDWKYFSTIEAAKKWVAENKVKTFDDYENEFLEEATTGEYSLDESFYQDLKCFHPKQYTQIIGQYIADDLNGDWKADWNNIKDKYYIYIDKDEYKSGFSVKHNNGLIYFKSKVICNQFIKIMGDKLNLLY